MRALLAWHNVTFKTAAVEISKFKSKLQKLANEGNSADNCEAIRKIRKDIDSYKNCIGGKDPD